MRAVGQGDLCYTATRTSPKVLIRRTGHCTRKSLTCCISRHIPATCVILKESVQRMCKPCAGVPHAWQGWCFALPLHPSRPSVDTWEPSEGSASRHRQGFTLGTHQAGLRAPWNPDQGASPLEPDEGLSRPYDHSPGLSRPGTHDQSFRTLDDEQGASHPCTLTRGMRPLDHAQDTLFLHLSRVSPRYRQWSGH
jgi:hypothetical protein